MNEHLQIKSSIIELPFSVITFRKEGYVHVHYKNCHLSLSDSETLFNALRKNSPWEKCPLLVSREEFATEDKEARVFNLSEPVTKHFSAVAFIANSLPKRLVFNFYKRFFRPGYPAKCFANPASAIEWLSLFASYNVMAKIWAGFYSNRAKANLFISIFKEKNE